MGMKLIVDTCYGISAEYHHICGFDWRKPFNLSVIVASFLTEEARDEGKQPLVVRSFQVASEEVEGFTPTLEFAYRSLMRLPEWEGAIGV
jgi:hypothetical protein